MRSWAPYKSNGIVTGRGEEKAMSNLKDDGGLFVNATLRDWLVGQGIAGFGSACASQVSTNIDECGGRKPARDAFIRGVTSSVLALAEAAADEYLRRRKERHDQ